MVGYYRAEDLDAAILEANRRIADSVRILWMSQDKLMRKNEKDLAFANMEKEVRRLVDREIRNLKEDVLDEADEQSMNIQLRKFQ